MIEKPSLEYLVDRSFKDSAVLFLHKRYAGSVYLGGYAIELVLKYRICIFLGFEEGYPETVAEFDRQKKAKVEPSAVVPLVRSIHDLKIHRLAQLLEYSGLARRIDKECKKEWNAVKDWNVSLRYNPATMRRSRAEKFHKAAALLLRVILENQ